MFNVKSISVIALILLLVGIIGGVFTFNSGKQTEDWEMEEKVINNEEIMNIKVMADNTKVEILPSNDTSTKVEFSGDDSKYHLSTDVEGTTLSIDVEYRQRKFINLDFFSSLSSLTVYVPEKVYDSLQLESDNGRITAETLQAKDINVKTNNGSIILEDIKSSAIIGEADNGRIELKDINSSTIQVKSDNGKIILEHVEGDILGETSNGSITLVTQDLDRQIELETDNGKINIQTEKEPTNVIFDIKVDNGKVRMFGESNWDSVIGNGDNLIKLTTNNGGITVTKEP